jgi:hypothetical protein
MSPSSPIRSHVSRIAKLSQTPRFVLGTALAAFLIVTSFSGSAVLAANKRQTAQASSPDLKLSSTSGYVGSKVALSGQGFANRQKGQILWDGSPTGMPTVRTSSTGEFSVSVTIPSSPAGVHTVTASIAGSAASVSYSVMTLAPTLTPVPTTSPTPQITPTPSSTSTPSPTATVAPVASNTSPVHLSLFYHPPKDGTSLQTVASRFRSMIFTRGDEGYREQLKSAGFSGPAMQYLMSNEASGPPGLRSSNDACGSYPYYSNNVAGIAGDFCMALHGDERLFLHNSRGERLFTTQSWQESTGTKSVSIYLMNPASPAWRSYFAQRALTNLQTLGYTGLFLDNLDLSAYRGRQMYDNSDGTVVEYPSDDTYRQAVLGYLAVVRQQFGNAAIWANLTVGSDAVSEWDAYLPYLSGAMEEYFVDRWNGTYASATAWESQLRRAEKTLSAGKSLVAVAQGTQSDSPRMRFGLASYLLVARDGANFRYADGNTNNVFDDPYATVWLYDDYQTKLGSPLGARYQSGNVWQRDFACGLVSADAANHNGSITLTPTRPGCS